MTRLGRMRMGRLRLPEWPVSVWALGIVVLLAGTLAAQQEPSPFPQPNDPRAKAMRADGESSLFDTDPGAMAKRARLLNSERQKEIVSDTDKLLKLAQQFNEEVAQSGTSNLTPDQVRKLAEIAKLAKGVKEKMTYGLGGTPPADPFGLTR